MTDHATSKSFDKHPACIVREAEPFNAEPSLEMLRASFITPRNLFYVRNHAPVPTLDADTFRLIVDGMTNKQLELSLEDLRRDFDQQIVVATLQCAGNRRDGMETVATIPGEVTWGAGAIGNAAWRGVCLRDVLQAAGVGNDARHVAFTGSDEVEKKGARFGFGGSIPIEKAMSDEVLLAYEMNGEALSPVHGFPLRAVVPGYLGARSVKWLNRITLRDAPSDNYYQAHAYKIFPPHVRPDTADWSSGLMLGEMSVNACICTPQHGATMSAGETVVQGYATAGGSRRVERVDVSSDDGATWIEAKLGEGDGSRTWRLWEARLELKAGAHRLVARAWDSAANTQPEDARRIWNFKGYMNNAWHRVSVDVR